MRGGSYQEFPVLKRIAHRRWSLGLAGDCCERWASDSWGCCRCMVIAVHGLTVVGNPF
jgi:hypothetical protein